MWSNLLNFVASLSTSFSISFSSRDCFQFLCFFRHFFIAFSFAHCFNVYYIYWKVLWSEIWNFFTPYWRSWILWFGVLVTSFEIMRDGFNDLFLDSKDRPLLEFKEVDFRFKGQISFWIQKDLKSFFFIQRLIWESFLVNILIKEFSNSFLKIFN